MKSGRDFCYERICIFSANCPKKRDPYPLCQGQRFAPEYIIVLEPQYCSEYSEEENLCASGNKSPKIKLTSRFTELIIVAVSINLYVILNFPLLILLLSHE